MQALNIDVFKITTLGEWKNVKDLSVTWELSWGTGELNPHYCKRLIQTCCLSI